VCAVSLFVYPNWLPPVSTGTGKDLVIQPPLTIRKSPRHRIDEVFPSILKSRTLQLTSVPTIHRMPTRVTNVTEFFISSSEHTAPYREYYFDYNPSIVTIPFNQRPRKDAVYLASFRVSNLNYCFHPGACAGKQMKKTNKQLFVEKGVEGVLYYCVFHFFFSFLIYCRLMMPFPRDLLEDRQRMVNHTRVQAKDWLGLALMDAEWQILTDAVFDLASIVKGAQDFRLFVLKTHDSSSSSSSTTTTIRDDDEHIYVSTNDVLVRMRLSPPTGDVSWTQLPLVFDELGPRRPTTTQLRAWVAASSHDMLCAPCGKPRSCGKNFHFFTTTTTGTTGQNRIWTEVWPSAPHLIRSVDKPCRRQNEPNQTYAAEESPVPSFRNREADILDTTGTTNAKDTIRRRARAPAWLTRGRGSACCIPIQHPQTGESLLMGIAHSKTLGSQALQPNHYLSTLYAFSNKPPFALIAQSGFFCLPFPSNGEPDDSIPMVNITRWRVLRLGEKLVYQDCPRIHFVSGMTLDARDPRKVVITYGINDCVSRFIQVSLSDLVKLLFFGTRSSYRMKSHQ